MRIQSITLSIFLLLSGASFGQVSSNTFAQSTGTYTSITGGTALWTTTFDDDLSGAVTIPSFTFNCTAYTQIYISANGYICFGSAPSGSNYTPVSGSDGTGIVSAFGADLQNATAGTREVRYQDLTGSGEFVIQWRDVRRYNIASERISFQIRLNYTTNVINIIYGGTITANAATTPTVEVGLRGLTNADFNNRTTTTNWAATTAGGTNAAACQFSGTIKPAVNQQYTFTPAAMTYVSCTAVQSVTTGVEKCMAGQEVLRVEVVTSGCTTPLTMTQIQLNMTGSTIAGTSTNDVSLIHIYYTGNTSTFSTSNAFDGAGTAVAAGTITIAGSRTLTSGTNYFWIAYDMNNTSTTIGNVIDAQCTSLTVGSVRTPTVTNPAGSRSIIACAGSPGGVSAGLSVWYKVDNTASITMGTGVASWASSSGSAGTWAVTQATGAQQPGVISGATGSRLFNYNPRLDFIAASNTVLGNSSTATDLMTASGSYFIISDNSTDDFTGMTYSVNTSTYRHQFKPGFRVQSSDASINGWTYDWTTPTEYSNLSACLTTVTGSGATMAARKNSVALAAANSNDITYSPSITTGLYMGRNNSGGEDTDANIGEIILYSSTPSAADINKIESYLAVKYGLTRGGNTNTGAAYNYLSSAGTTIWNKTTNSGFNNDIAGIGRDDASALFQKQSISVNNNEPVTVGLTAILGSNALNTNNFSADQSFLIWGNNGLSNQITTNPACFANLPAGIYGHIERVWKGQATNFSQSVTVGFETGMLVAYTPVSNLRLLVDNDGVNWTDATVYSGAVINGARVEFSGITVSSAKPFFTLASTSSVTLLPVELLGFQVYVDDDRQVKIGWKTASELNCDYFTIEKSSDGTVWKLLETSDGAGTSTVVHQYGLTDDQPFPGVSYYRLLQTDFDGTISDLGTRSVILDQEEELIVYPNPARNTLTIAFNDHVVHQILLLDVQGRVMLRTEVLGSRLIAIDHLAAGVYFLQAESGTERRIVIE
jgi:trimeric autotransporter adhesin